MIDCQKKLHEKHEKWLVKKTDIESYLVDVPILILECNKDFESNESEQQKHIDSIVSFFNLYHVLLPKEKQNSQAMELR